jgi:hypothetical protein
MDYHLPKYEDSKINPEFLRANSNSMIFKCSKQSADKVVRGSNLGPYERCTVHRKPCTLTEKPAH